MAVAYRIIVQVMACEDRGVARKIYKHTDLSPAEFEVKTRDGMAAVVRAEAGELAVHLFEKVWDSLYPACLPPADKPTPSGQI